MWLIDMRRLLALVALLLNPLRCISVERIDVQFCGFAQTCSGNRTDIEQKNDSCCKPCECADSCRERDTCCEDKEWIEDTKEVIKQQCLPAVYKPERQQYFAPIFSYFTRTRCPTSFKDLSIIEKCETELIESFDHITFVSSEDGTIVYKNKFCSLCHGESRTVPWKLSVLPVCVRLLEKQNLTLTAFTSFLLEQCSISFKEPDNLVYGQTVCFDKTMVRSQCNETGEWEVYDSKLEDLCRQSPESVFYYKQVSTLVHMYRSVYCYLCNARVSVVQESCNMNKRSSSDGVFTNLIKQSALTSYDDEQRISTKCNAGQILDTFFNTCRQLYCPLFFLPSHGQCIRILESNLYNTLLVRLVPQDAVNKSESLRNDLLSRHPRIAMKLGFGQCEICSPLIVMETGLDDAFLLAVYYEVLLKATERCKLEYLLSQLTTIEMRPSKIKLTLNNKLVHFIVFWDDHILHGENRSGEYLRPKSNNCWGFPPERASNCAKVKLVASEYQYVLKNHLYANELLFAPSQEDANGTVYICIDNYIKQLHSTGVGKRLSIAIAMFTFIVDIYIQNNIFKP